VSATEALMLGLAAHRLFAHEAAMPVKDGMAPGRAERMVLVVDRSRELGAAACVNGNNVAWYVYPFTLLALKRVRSSAVAAIQPLVFLNLPLGKIFGLLGMAW
jgi:hypothetical protein